MSIIEKIVIITVSLFIILFLCFGSYLYGYHKNIIEDTDYIVKFTKGCK